MRYLNLKPPNYTIKIMYYYSFKKTVPAPYCSFDMGEKKISLSVIFI